MSVVPIARIAISLPRLLMTIAMANGQWSVRLSGGDR